MEKYNYLLLNIVAFVPITLYLIFKFKKILSKHINVLLFTTLFGFIAFFLVDPPAVWWDAWHYDYSHTLGITFMHGVLIEELMWAIFIGFLLGCYVVISADAEDREYKGKKVLTLKGRLRKNRK